MTPVYWDDRACAVVSVLNKYTYRILLLMCTNVIIWSLSWTGAVLRAIFQTSVFGKIIKLWKCLLDRRTSSAVREISQNAPASLSRSCDAGVSWETWLKPCINSNGGLWRFSVYHWSVSVHTRGGTIAGKCQSITKIRKKTTEPAPELGRTLRPVSFSTTA